MASTSLASPAITNIYGFTLITFNPGFLIQNSSGFTVVQFGYNLIATPPAGTGTFDGGFQVACPIALPNGGVFTAENQVGGTALVKGSDPSHAIGLDLFSVGCVQAQNGTNRISVDFRDVARIPGVTPYVVSLNFSIFASV